MNTLARSIDTNFLKPHIFQDPYPYFYDIRDVSGIVWHETLDCWLLGSYDSSFSVLAGGSFTSDPRELGVKLNREKLNVQNTNGEDHLLFRKVLSGAYLDAFKKIDLKSLVSDAIYNFKSTEKPCVMSDLAIPLASGFCGDFIGIGRDQIMRILPLSLSIMKGMDKDLDIERAGFSKDAQEKLNSLVREWLQGAKEGTLLAAIRDRSREAGIATASTIVNTKQTIQPAFASIFCTLGNTIDVLLKQNFGISEMLDIFDSRDLYLECSRLNPTVNAIGRYCSSDTIIHSRRIKKGDYVTVLVAAANTDSVRFDKPNCFLPSRKKHPILNFGAGRHSCLGEKFATEICVLVLDSIRKMELSFEMGSTPASYYPLAAMRCPKNIFVDHCS